MADVICYSQTNQGQWCQESYETASRDARRRVAQLREAGYSARVTATGPQVTGAGMVRLTLVHIRPGVHSDTYGLPDVKVVSI